MRMPASVCVRSAVGLVTLHVYTHVGVFVNLFAICCAKIISFMCIFSKEFKCLLFLFDFCFCCFEILDTDFKYIYCA